MESLVSCELAENKVLVCVSFETFNEQIVRCSERIVFIVLDLGNQIWDSFELRIFLSLLDFLLDLG